MGQDKKEKKEKGKRKVRRRSESIVYEDNRRKGGDGVKKDLAEVFSYRESTLSTNITL